MKVVRESQFHIEPEDDVPFDSQNAVIERQLASELARLDDNKKQVDSLGAMEIKYKTQIKKLMGKRKYDQFRDYAKTEYDSLYTNLFPPRGPEMSLEERKKLRIERKENSLKFLKEIDVDIAELQKMNSEWRKKLEKLVRPLPEAFLKPEPILLPKDVPLEIREMKANPWTIKEPPYSSWAWSYDGWVGGFSFHPTLYLDSAAGLAGHKNYLKDSNASDWDAGYVTYNTQVGFWYKMPETNMLEVYILARVAFNLHHCCLRDEFGWSDSFVHQDSYVTMRIDGPNSDETRTSRTSWWYEDGYNSGCWDESYLSDGGRYWFHFYSTAPYSKDTWVNIFAGLRTFNKCFANDVAVYSYPKFKWYIEKVYVRPAP